VSSIETLIREGRQAVEKQDDDAVKSVSERLEKEAHRIASVMYQQAGAGAGGAPGADGGAPGAEGGAPPDAAGGGKKKDGGVIDAEFEETP
jgi:molecular chaperone DnaK